MKKTASIIAGISILVGLFLISRYSYLLFHVLAETFSIVIACSIFIIAWNCRRFTENNYLLLLGIAYLFVGSLDFVHTLAYRGMGVFPDLGADPATQLWIAARYLEGLSLAAVPILLEKKFRPALLFFAYGLGFLALIGSIFLWDVFPACYIDGVGLTAFKKGSELVICLLFLTSAALLWNRRRQLDRNVLRYLLISIGFTIGSELSFVLYFDVYGLMNLFGHLLKTVSFYFIYKAILETGLEKPYDLLFRELSESELRYRSLFSHMIDGVARHRILYDDQGSPVDFVFLEANLAFGKMLGLDRENIIGKRATEAIPGIEDDPADWIGAFGRLTAQSRPLRFERYFAPLCRWFSVIAYSFEDGEFVAVFEDITARKQAQETLKQYNEELEKQVNERTAQLENTLEHLKAESAQRLKAESDRRRAQQELLDAVQEEQQRIGRDLHDTVQGSLVGVRYMIENLENAVAEKESELVAGLQRAEGVISQVVGQVRALAHSLNPVNLKGKGLGQALAALAANTEKLFEMPCRYRSETDSDPLPEDAALQLYYIAQEAVNNAVKHAAPGKIDIRLFSQDGRLALSVQDDGVGFRNEDSADPGMGLQTMGYRAALIGGKLEIRRRPEGGTAVLCRLPKASLMAS